MKFFSLETFSVLKYTDKIIYKSGICMKHTNVIMMSMGTLYRRRKADQSNEPRRLSSVSEILLVCSLKRMVTYTEVAVTTNNESRVGQITLFTTNCDCDHDKKQKGSEHIRHVITITNAAILVRYGVTMMLYLMLRTRHKKRSIVMRKNDP